MVGLSGGGRNSGGACHGDSAYANWHCGLGVVSLNDGITITEDLSRVLFTKLLLPFEVTSVLILIAILGAVALARHGHGDTDAQEKGRRANESFSQEVPISWYLLLSAVLFSLGVVGFLIKRNLITVFMSIELMLNAVNLSFVTFAHRVACGEGADLCVLCDDGGRG